MEQAGGGWYGGGGAGNRNSTYRVPAGGGGGSGYVWTSSTASNVPSGYTVGTEYYLTDATTYAGNTSFTSPSGRTETGHSGDGYARISLLSATVDRESVEKSISSWLTIEEQIENGTFTGTFEQNGNTVIATEVIKESPTIVENSDDEDYKTTTKFGVKTMAESSEGGTLTYELLASTSQYGTYYSVMSSTKESGVATSLYATSINGTALKEYNYYWWRIKVTDASGLVTISSPQRTSTYCSGYTYAYADESYGIEETYPCGSCDGAGGYYGTGDTLESSTDYKCGECGGLWTDYEYSCSSCGGGGSYGSCFACGAETIYSYCECYTECDSCGGSGTSYSWVDYYKCTICGHDATTSYHKCLCSHGYSSKHDD